MWKYLEIIWRYLQIHVIEYMLKPRSRIFIQIFKDIFNNFEISSNEVKISSNELKISSNKLKISSTKWKISSNI